MKPLRNLLIFILGLFGILCFRFVSVAADQSAELNRQGDHIEVTIGGQPFTTYYFSPEAPKPYLHPLRSAQGTIVTRGYPMVKNIPGESHDHPHHRGLFYAHGEVNGIDFWGEESLSRAAQTAQGKFYASQELPHGRTVFRKLDEIHSGPHAGNLRATFDLVGPDRKVIGSETQAYTFGGDRSTRTFDCEFTTRADHGVAIKMGDTKEGTFAIRVVKSLEEPLGHMVNSNGAVGEKGIWGKRADWVDYYGKVGSEEVGIAIFDSPTNPKHPTYWHARGYGLFAVNPFGERDFYNDKTRDGSVTVPVGGSLTFRYRVLIHHGDAHGGHLSEAYQDYEKRP